MAFNHFVQVKYLTPELMRLLVRDGMIVDFGDFEPEKDGDYYPLIESEGETYYEAILDRKGIKGIVLLEPHIYNTLPEFGIPDTVWELFKERYSVK